MGACCCCSIEAYIICTEKDVPTSPLRVRHYWGEELKNATFLRINPYPCVEDEDEEERKNSQR